MTAAFSVLSERRTDIEGFNLPGGHAAVEKRPGIDRFGHLVHTWADQHLYSLYLIAHSLDSRGPDSDTLRAWYLSRGWVAVPGDVALCRLHSVDITSTGAA